MSQRASGGSRGVWLPSLPSPEEALENTDNKNSCSSAKRKCHFYPGLVLGKTGATSPMGSEDEGQLRPGGRTGERSPDPKAKGQRVWGIHRKEPPHKSLHWGAGEGSTQVQLGPSGAGG